jgi:GDP-L-fucose synthase
VTDFLKNKRIVITGGAGFLGLHLQQRFLEHGVNAEQLLIPTIDDYDLTKEADVVRMYEEMSPNVVIHLAAEVGGIGANRENPGRYFYANMAMGLHLAEQGRLHTIDKFVQIGTVCAYPKFTPVPFKEDDIWDGYPEETNAPYGIAKKAMLVMLQGYRAQYGMNGIYLLPVNLYGPGDNFNPASSHVIPALIKKIVDAMDENRDVIECWGTGSASREFIYAPDAAEGIVLATEQYNGGEPVNIGAGSEITIKDLVEKIAQLAGFEGDIHWDPSKPDGQPRRCLDTTRAKEYFGFQAQTDFDAGLKATIDWYQQNKAVLKF